MEHQNSRPIADQWIRLKNEQETASEQTETDIQEWEKFKADYVKLQKRLRDLPKTLTQDTMVPFGKKAFMKGNLVHTNEILVLLGDNWFVERSASQAVDIVARRLVAVEQNLSKLKEQKKLLDGRATFTKEFIEQHSDECFEIQEEYVEEKEKEWKERHKHNVRVYRQSHNHSYLNMKSPDETKTGSVDNVWQRLNELEICEETNNEIQSSELTPSRTTEKNVRWANDPVSYENDTDDTVDNCIVFSHTPSCVTSELSIGDSSIDIVSPADIYTHYYIPTPILKNNSKEEPLTKGAYSYSDTFPADARKEQSLTHQVNNHGDSLGVTQIENAPDYSRKVFCEIFERTAEIIHDKKKDEVERKKLSKFKQQRRKDGNQ